MTCAPGTGRLVCGRVVSTASEAWRHETEARTILAFPLLIQRRAHLATIEAKRGTHTAQKIRGTMLQIWQAQQALRGNDGEHAKAG